MKTKSITMAAILAASFLFFHSSVKAQTVTKGKWQIVVSAEASAAANQGYISANNKLGIGAGAGVQYGLTDNIGLTLSSGYYHFNNGDYWDVFANAVKPGGGSNYIPLKAGVKTFLVKGLYVSAEAGAVHELKTGETRMLVAPGIGYAIGGFDAGLRYESRGEIYRTASSFTALHVAYGFQL